MDEGVTYVNLLHPLVPGYYVRWNRCLRLTFVGKRELVIAMNTFG